MKKRNKYEIIHFMHSGKPSLMKINPNIEKLMINLDFYDIDTNTNRKFQSELNPTDSSAYTHDCINHSCTKGFFDLTDQIYFLLRDRKDHETGVVNCEGWQDEERINNHRCLVKLNYEIRAIYRSI